MPKRFEIPKPQITNESGGSLNAKSYDGLSDVSITDYGEFMTELLANDELLSVFPNFGLTCVYFSDGKLGSVSVELTTFLDLQFRTHKLNLADNPDLFRLVERLKQERQTVFITAYPTLGAFETQILGPEGREIETVAHEDLDFKFGIYGSVNLYGVEVAYQFVNTPDEMTVAIGDVEPDQKMLAIVVSRDLDYLSELNSKDARRFHRLARKIILNN